MGNSGGRKLTDQELQVFSSQSQLQPFVIRQIYDAFMDRAGKDGRMKINDFKLSFMQIYPNANMFTMDADAERIFMIFDVDRNGVLTFDEFLAAYIQMQRGLV